MALHDLARTYLQPLPPSSALCQFHQVAACCFPFSSSTCQVSAHFRACSPSRNFLPPVFCSASCFASLMSQLKCRSSDKPSLTTLHNTDSLYWDSTLALRVFPSYSHAACLTFTFYLLFAFSALEWQVHERWHMHVLSGMDCSVSVGSSKYLLGA